MYAIMLGLLVVNVCMFVLAFLLLVLGTVLVFLFRKEKPVEDAAA